VSRPPASALGRYLRPLGPMVAFVAVAVVATRLTSATVVAGVVLGLAIVVGVVVVVYVRQGRDGDEP
jgi:hypothetical protein